LTATSITSLLSDESSFRSSFIYLPFGMYFDPSIFLKRCSPSGVMPSIPHATWHPLPSTSCSKVQCRLLSWDLAVANLRYTHPTDLRSLMVPCPANIRAATLVSLTAWVRDSLKPGARIVNQCFIYFDNDSQGLAVHDALASWRIVTRSRFS